MPQELVHIVNRRGRVSNLKGLKTLVAGVVCALGQSQ